MNIIGIDASINSTAICVETSGIETYHCFTNTSKLSKWMKILEPVVRYHFIEYTYPSVYSESEIYKITKYLDVANEMMQVIPDNCLVGMESYSQSSNAGKLVDLVTLGSFIRMGVLSKKSDLHLYAPMTMKKEACKNSYNISDAKKKVYRNLEGVAGGSFKKHEMMKAMVYYTRDKEGTLYDLLKQHSEEMLSLKSIPSPWDDIIDAFWAKEITKIIFSA